MGLRSTVGAPAPTILICKVHKSIFYEAIHIAMISRRKKYEKACFAFLGTFGQKMNSFKFEVNCWGSSYHKDQSVHKVIPSYYTHIAMILSLKKKELKCPFLEPHCWPQIQKSSPICMAYQNIPLCVLVH